MVTSDPSLAKDCGSAHEGGSLGPVARDPVRQELADLVAMSKKDVVNPVIT